jgi:non-homologous end joining protein Ku
VKQKLVNPKDESGLKSENVEKGAPVGPGRYVVLSGEDLASVEPQESRTIEVVRFIPADALDRAYFGARPPLRQLGRIPSQRRTVLNTSAP